jgi:Protein of unknown function (DUF4199)
MERTATPTVTPAAVGIRYGLLMGIVGVILDFLLKTTGSDFKHPIIATLLALSVWVVGITFAHRYFKQQNGGLMTYGQGVIIGVLVGAIYGILSGLFSYIYINYLDPGYVESIRTYTEDTLANFNLPEEAVEQGLADITTEKLASPLTILKTSFGGAIGGLILSLIISAITKKNRPEFE